MSPVIISDQLVLSAAGVALRSQARIGYENLFLDGTVTVTSEATGYPIDNALDWLTYDYWRPTSTASQTVEVALGSAEACDYFGLAAHNFSESQPTIYFEYWDGAAWVECIGPAQQTTDAPVMGIFLEVTATKYRFRFLSSAAVPSIGVLTAGKAMQLQRGVQAAHTPITLGQEIQYLDNMSEGGQWLGRSIIATGVETVIDLKHLDADWVRDEFDAFRVACRKQGFFWAWAPTDHPTEVAYVWLMQEPRPVYPQNGFALMDVSLNVRGTWDVI
jgi:hypothetical protein